jgi:hypothetical protein
MSTQCMEDLESCIIGFIELCSKLLTHENNVNILLTPALMLTEISTVTGANNLISALQIHKRITLIFSIGVLSC